MLAATCSVMEFMEGFSTRYQAASENTFRLEFGRLNTQILTRKEVITMKYEKPEVTVLASAMSAIQGACAKSHGPNDSGCGQPRPTPSARPSG